MSRRTVIMLLLVGGLLLYAIPLVNPLPAMDPTVDAQRNLNSTATPHDASDTTIHYEELAPDAQQWFDSVPQSDGGRNTASTPIDRLPETWQSIVPDGTNESGPAKTTADIIPSFSYESRHIPHFRRCSGGLVRSVERSGSSVSLASDGLHSTYDDTADTHW